MIDYERFTVTAYDCDGCIITCDMCDKHAGYQEIHQVENSDAYYIFKRCVDHSPLAGMSPAICIYNPDNKPEYKIADVPPIVNKSWIMNIKNDKDK